MGVLSLLWTNAATVFPWQEVSGSRAGASAEPPAARSVYQQPPTCGNRPASAARAARNLWILACCTGEGRLSGEFYADSDSQEVVAVAGTLRSGPRPNILNSDGQRHPVGNALTIFTLLPGPLSCALG